MTFRADRQEFAAAEWRSRLGSVTALALLLLAFACAPVAAVQARVPVPDVSAGSVFAFDPSTGEVIMAQLAEERHSIGSITKVMTALVVMDHVAPGDPVEIQRVDMVEEGFSTMWLQPGHTLTVEQLLTGLLVSSGGDAAKALARHTGETLAGTTSAEDAVAAFVEAMNEKAGTLGLAGTRFANPDGADDEDAWSTARDVAIMYAFLHRDSTLAQIAGLTEYAFTSVGPESASYAGVTTNQLAGQYGVRGAKTGSTGDAGGCLVLARETAGGETVIVATLGSTLTYDEAGLLIVDDARWTDAIAIIDAIDTGWTPGQNLAAATGEVERSGPNEIGGADTLPDLEPAPVETARATPTARPLLAVMVASGVLAFAAVFARSQTTPRWARSAGATNSRPYRR